MVPRYYSLDNWEKLFLVDAGKVVSYSLTPVGGVPSLFSSSVMSGKQTGHCEPAVLSSSTSFCNVLRTFKNLSISTFPLSLHLSGVGVHWL